MNIDKAQERLAKLQAEIEREQARDRIVSNLKTALALARKREMPSALVHVQLATDDIEKLTDAAIAEASATHGNGTPKPEPAKPVAERKAGAANG